MTKDSKKLLEIIKSAKNVAIFAHKSVDPDALGSMFGAREFCRALGVSADVFSVCDKNFFVKDIFPMDEIKSEFKPEEYDLVIMTDCHSVNRLDKKFSELVNNFKDIVVVDHHEVSEKEGQVNSKCSIIFPNYAASCEVWAEIFADNGIKFTAKTATYLYCGLMGDTDRFLHGNLTLHVFDTAKTLFENGAKIQFVHDVMYRKETKKQIKLKNDFYNRIHYVPDGAYVIYTMKDYKKLNADFEDVKMFSNSLLCIEGVKASIFVYEASKNHFKFSARSASGKARDLAVKMGGGGHKCAAGFECVVTKRELNKKLPLWIGEMLHD